MITKIWLRLTIFSLAGAVGIEPTLEVLETTVIPLHHAPKFNCSHYTLSFILLPLYLSLIPPYTSSQHTPPQTPNLNINLERPETKSTEMLL